MDKAEASDMRRKSRQVDNVDVLDSISNSIIDVTSRLADVIKRSAVKQQVPIQSASRTHLLSLSDEIDSAYKRRKQAQDTNRSDAVARWDEQIDKLESLEHERISTQY